jgi:hypothetical protein
MSNPIFPIPQYPIFVWPAAVPQLDFVWTVTGGSADAFSTAAGNYALIADYTGATLYTTAFLAAAASTPEVNFCAIVFVGNEPRVRIGAAKPGTIQLSATAAKHLGFALNGTHTITISADNAKVTGSYCPFGYWQPLSHTPWYERHKTAQAFVSESIGGGFRYRTEWGVKQSAVFSASNVRRGVIYRDATNVKGSGAPIDGSFSAAAGKAVGDDNNTLEGMIDAARTVDILSLLGGDYLSGGYMAGVSIINADILSDFETILAETDGKRMYDVSLPLRHIGFG